MHEIKMGKDDTIENTCYIERQLQYETNYHLVFWSRMRKIPKNGGKKVFSLSFLDPSSPRLASGSPGLPNDFRVKELARLGEQVTLGVSLNKPGRAPARLGELQVHQNDHLPINRRARGAEKSFQGPEGEGIEWREKEEEEEERSSWFLQKEFSKDEK